MSSDAKIYLSEQEQELMYNAEWILTKRKIIDKMVQFFDSISLSMNAYVEKNRAGLPLEVAESRNKISKGENYLGLPYVMLDYPGIFKNENIFAVRTMFWWGNSFSVTLQLSGVYKDKFQEMISTKLQKTSPGFFVCVNEDPWQHHFEPDNYLPADEISASELTSIFDNRKFIKIAVKISLEKWADAGHEITTAFEDLLKLVKD